MEGGNVVDKNGFTREWARDILLLAFLGIK